MTGNWWCVRVYKSEKMEDQQKVPQREISHKQKRSANYKKLALILLVVILLLGGGAWYFISNNMNSTSNTAQALNNLSPSDPIARVNGEEITRSDLDTIQAQILSQQGIDPATLDAAMQQELLTQALNAVVAQTLLRQEVENAKINVGEDEVSTQLEEIKAQYENDSEYAQVLKSQNMTEDDLKTQIGENLRTQKYLDGVIDTNSLSVSGEEVDAAYKQVATNTEDVPPLEDMREQIEDSIIQQKQQQLVAQHIQQLQQKADIELLI